MDRKLNALLLFVGVVIFIVSADPTQQWNILVGIVLASIFSFGAFVFKGLSLDGMFSAIVVGIFAFGLGGWKLAVVLVLFFVSSVAISDRPTWGKNNIPEYSRRDGLQVWANSFWMVVFLICSTIFKAPIFLIGAIAAIATATSDTWATELGSKDRDNTYLITTFEHVAPGTDGAISVKGTGAALFAAVMISTVSVYVFSLHLSVFIIILITAFLGCFIDSYLGAIFQQNKRIVTVPATKVELKVSNNLVNTISTGLGGLLAIIFKLFFA
ncbi:DUF92 domain-containing protein [Fodinibius sp. Rm-B-1B1-1]|uniref:DUF92 domain-containing protein n=1 Tax=Fodinibius alkaliphilus TaxID=3140241 RepID=UPI003159B164